MYFYPRSPCGERRLARAALQTCQAISIHALLAESDLFLRSGPMTRRYFYPRSPCGERLFSGDHGHISGDISIHALLAESDFAALHNILKLFSISIHALLAESDPVRGSASFVVLYHFYPRSPCGERQLSPPKHRRPRRFLSTLSLRRATLFLRCGPMTRRYFYPRSPCGERRRSSNALPSLSGFLSTLSLRRATGCVRYCTHAPGISIHALLAESDSAPRFTPTASRNFYPRSPCGERPTKSDQATNTHRISIHALLAESDKPK